MQQLKQFADVEFRAKDLIIQLKNEGYTGFQIQIIGTQLWDTGAIMAFDAARFGTVPPLPVSPPPCTPVIRMPPPPAVQVKEPAQPAAASAGAIKAPLPAPVIPSPAPATPATLNPDEEVYTCQICYGVVDAKAKKASQFFFSKTLCPNCNDKERIKAVKDRDEKAKVNKK